MPNINNDKHAENVSLLLILLLLHRESFRKPIYFLPSNFSMKLYGVQFFLRIILFL